MDHLVIGILLGLASGIAALLVIAVAALRRFDATRDIESVRLHRALADTQRIVRQEVAALRRDVEAVASGQERQAQALAASLGQLTHGAVTELREHPLPALHDLAERQDGRLTALAEDLERRLAALTGDQEQRLATLAVDQKERLAILAGELTRLSEAMAADAAGHAKDLRNELLESLRITLDEFRAAHAIQVAQVRASIDEKLERTVEARLGESFRMVSERLDLVSARLDSVHRGLGEVQSFAAGLGHLQRAVATVRLGSGKAGTGRARPSRRKAAAAGDAAAEAAAGPVPVEVSQGS